MGIKLLLNELAKTGSENKEDDNEPSRCEHNRAWDRDKTQLQGVAEDIQIFEAKSRHLFAIEILTIAIIRGATLIRFFTQMPFLLVGVWVYAKIDLVFWSDSSFEIKDIIMPSR